MARPELEHFRPGRPRRRARAEGRAATDGDRQGLSLSRQLVWPDAVAHRRVCLSRWLSRFDGRLGRRPRVEFLRRRARARYPPPCPEISRHWSPRHAFDSTIAWWRNGHTEVPPREEPPFSSNGP